MATTHTPTLADLRLSLANRRAELREAQTRFPLVQAQAENRIIEDAISENKLVGRNVERGLAVGSTPDEHRRELLIRLEGDEEFTRERSHLACLQHQVDILDAQVRNLEADALHNAVTELAEYMDRLWSVLSLAGLPTKRLAERPSSDDELID